MRLGKRYIAIVSEVGETATLDASCSPSKEQCEQAFRNFHNNVAPYATLEDVVEIDLDNGKRRHESDEGCYARNERVMLDAAAEVERLKPIVGAPVGEAVKPDEPDNDITFEPWPPRRQGGQQVGVSAGIIAVHRPTGIAVIREERSQLRNRDEAIMELRKIVGAQRDHDRARPKGIACAGCGGADSVCNCECGYHPCGCSCHKPEPVR